MSLLEDVFSLTKKEQIALLEELEKKASAPSPIALPQEVIDTFELPDEIDIEDELAKIKEIVLAEIQSVTINAPKGDKGDKGDKGAVGPQGPKGADGVAGKDGKQGVDGKDGIDGISVTDARVDFDGSLVITLSNGQEINAGDVIPNDKKDLIIQSLKNSTLSLTELGIEDFLSSPTPIGNVTPNTGKFTTLTTSGKATIADTSTVGQFGVKLAPSFGAGSNWDSKVALFGNVNLASGAGSGAFGVAFDTTQGSSLMSIAPALAWYNMKYLANTHQFFGLGFEQLRVTPTNSAVNYVQVTGSATGSLPIISVQGSDANIPLAINSKGASAVRFASQNADYPILNGGTGTVSLGVAGSSTNIDLAINSKGTGNIVGNVNSGSFTIGRDSANNAIKFTAPSANLYLQTTGGGVILFNTGDGTPNQMRVAHTASAVNYVQVTGGATGSPVIVSAQGSDASIPIRIRSKGTFNIQFENSSLQQGLVVSPTGSANYLQITSANASSAPILASVGSDTNINLNLIPKGTGVVQQNGTPLALSTHKYHAFNVGTYYFDNYNQDNYLRLFTQNATADTIRYGTVTSPEYYDYGTSTWTAWAAGQSGIQNLLDGNPSTGMDVAHANRTFRFIVNASDGWPTNALVMLQSTWSAVTYTTATVTIASSTTVGGTYTSRQVMVFSPANTGNNWGMHAYYASTLHTGDQFYRITIDLTDWVNSGIYLTYPLRNLSVYSNYSNIAGRQVPYSNSFDKTTAFIGGISTPNDANGILTVGRYSSGNTQAIIDTPSSTTAMLLRTQSFAQVRIAHTASAVNYVELSGGTTSNGVTFSAQGSDANINTFISSKGTGVTVFNTGVGEQFRVATISNAVNNLQAYGATIGNAPAIGARGTDANVDIALIPKGTGRVKFGTYTAGMLVNTGYIEIVDSGGTVRKLAVVA